MVFCKGWFRIRPWAGRPLEFEPQGAIDAAMQLFWERGYEQTSLQDLEGRTGLSRSSLYNTFDLKRALFTLALDRYRVQLHDRVLADLEAGTAGLGDLHRFVDAVGAGLADPEVAWGCLMINSLAEFGGRDADVVRYGQAYMEQFRSAIAGGLDRAASLGEIDPTTVDGRTLLLLGLVLGARQRGGSLGCRPGGHGRPHRRHPRRGGLVAPAGSCRRAGEEEHQALIAWVVTAVLQLPRTHDEHANPVFGRFRCRLPTCCIRNTISLVTCRHRPTSRMRDMVWAAFGALAVTVRDPAFTPWVGGGAPPLPRELGRDPLGGGEHGQVDVRGRDRREDRGIGDDEGVHAMDPTE